MADYAEEQAREARRAQHYAYNRWWREQNVERSRQLNRESAHRATERHQRTRAHRAAQRSWYQRNIEQEREKGRRYREQYPERIREASRRFRERHPDRAREQSRRAAQHYRDKNATAIRVQQMERAAATHAAHPDAYRQWYQKNLEQQRARVKAASAQRQRLKQLGLPPRHVQRVYAADKRANAFAAEAFFTRRRSAERLRELERETSERPTVPDETLRDATGTTRAAKQLMSARARQLIEADRATPPGLIARFKAESAIARHHARLRERIVRGVEEYRALHADEVRADVEADDAARRVGGKPPLDIDLEVDARIRAGALEAFRASLPGSVRAAGVALLIEATTAARDPSWWGRATRDDIKRAYLLSRDPVAGPQTVRDTLRQTVDHGVMVRYGVPTRAYLLGLTANDLAYLRREAARRESSAQPSAPVAGADLPQSYLSR